MRVLITGAARDLGAAVASRLQSAREVDSIVGIDSLPSPGGGKLEMIRADTRHSSVTGIVAAIGADVLVHCAIRSASGGVSAGEAHETNVSGTLNVLAGCGSTTRRVVIKSGVAVYGHSPAHPSVLNEAVAEQPGSRTPAGRDLSEVEQLVLDHQLANPGSVLTILRLGTILATGWETPLAAYLRLSPVPTVAGYDPRLQLLGGADAVDAFHRAALADHPGIFNVASEGVILLSGLIRLAGAGGAARLPPLAGTWLQRQALRVMSGHEAPLDLLDLLSRGRVVDCSALLAEFGWRPPRATRDVVEEWVAERLSSPVGA